MKKILLICLLIPGVLLAEDGWRQKLRPHLNQYLGVEFANKLLGEKVEEISLPDLPVVNKSATMTTPDEEIDQRESKLSADQTKQFNFYYVRELYTATRNLKANDDELSKWLNAMEQGATREGVYRALVLDNTYAGLENYPSPLTDSAMEFAVHLHNIYLGKPLSKEGVMNINFYTLKRISVENALDIIDSYRGKEEDLYRWYAVLSAEIAEKFPTVWNGKIRGVKDRSTHFDWAKSVPFQHLKSEVIIKLHLVFNHLKG